MVPDTLTDLFRRSYGAAADVVASAPGRVNLIGEHLDYNGGEVLPIAIASRTWVAMRRRSGSSQSRAISSTEEDTGVFESPAPIRSGRWWDYISGLGSLPGKRLPAVDIAVVSDVPAGAGLSSSAALEVAAGCAYAALAESEMSLRDIALDAWRVETEFVGVSCGIMDQFASALCSDGHALHISCDTTETRSVPFRQTVLIFDTASPRSLRSSEFNTRRSECTEALLLLRRLYPELTNLASATTEQISRAQLPEKLQSRAIHVATEMTRVRRALQTLAATGTITPEVLYDSHASLRDRYECSSRELDWFVDRARRTDGIEGARLTGAGWGGCAIAFGTSESLVFAGNEIAREYEELFGHSPRVWQTDASGGARIDRT